MGMLRHCISPLLLMRSCLYLAKHPVPSERKPPITCNLAFFSTSPASNQQDFPRSRGHMQALNSIVISTEQEHLNNVAGARLRISGLRAESGPGVEFLDYLTPKNGRPPPADTQANDLWHWQTIGATIFVNVWQRRPAKRCDTIRGEARQLTEMPES